MKPLLLSQSDSNGGAARAAYRLHNALLVNGIESRMQVAVKKTDLTTIESSGSKWKKFLFSVRPYFSMLLMRMQKPTSDAIQSVNFLNSGMVQKLNKSEYDLLNIHWVNNEFLSIEDIGNIQKPKVLTLHDMWAFCGAEHYAEDALTSRWCNGYTSKNRPGNQTGLDLDKWVWMRKSKAWVKPMHIVTPSHWLAKCVKNSALMRDWPVTVIPNAIDTDVYKPWSKAIARDILKLPKNVNLVLFGAIGGGADLRKGWHLLQDSLKLLAKELSNVECVVFGQSEPNNPPKVGLPIHWLGHLSDDATLALLYSAADVMVVPSIQDNLPQSATEAQSCGCPVVGFNSTGLPDVVNHKKTGYLATPYDTSDLASGIAWVLYDSERRAELSKNARENAEKKFTNTVVASLYKEMYAKVLLESTLNEQ